VQVNGSLVPFIELGVGFNPELTGRENVFLNGALLGFSHDEMEAMYDDIVDFAELHNFMDERLKNYSSGMQVRLAFSIAIRAQGDILLLDEVLAVGDEAFQQKCFTYFADKKKASASENIYNSIINGSTSKASKRMCTPLIKQNTTTTIILIIRLIRAEMVPEITMIYFGKFILRIKSPLLIIA
jgi:ABC-2 type transport system ATP-binding protein